MTQPTQSDSPVQVEPSKFKTFEYQFNGQWMPNISPVHAGVRNYTNLVNLRPTLSGFETVDGYSAITETALTNPINMHYYSKENESHVIAKTNESGNYYLYSQETFPPTAAEFNAAAAAQVGAGLGSFANGPRGTLLYADESNTLISGGSEMSVGAFFSGNYALGESASDLTQEVNNKITSEYATISTSIGYFFVCSPLKLSGARFYILNANVSTSTMSVAQWTGAAFAAVSGMTDGTTSGGISLAQTGSVTWTYSESAAPRWFNGVAMYVYRFTINTGTADVYRVSAIAPLQPVRDNWNGTDRACISFQNYRSSQYEDHTFGVNSTDSSADSIYGADIEGLTSSDTIEIMFEKRTMAINITMVTGHVNTAAAAIAAVNYWTGSAWAAASWISDGTLTSTSSFSRSGTLAWNPPAYSAERPQSKFGKYGYVYQITLNGTIDDGVAAPSSTVIDTVGGVTAPLNVVGYNRVGTYNGRAMLVNGNKVDFSQTSAPWTYNGIDASIERGYTLEFGDETPIVATAEVYNVFGSNAIAPWVVLKPNATYALFGNQPEQQYPDYFTIKEVDTSIGCIAPMTVKTAGIDFADGIKRRVVCWLDSSGPVAFDGAFVKRLEGVENYFDPSNINYINTDYIGYATAYMDTVHNQYNIMIPTGDSTVNNKWIAYDFKTRKWFEKIPASHDSVLWDASGDQVLWDGSGDAILWASPESFICTTGVTDASGIRYNYGIISDGTMVRIDHGTSWGGLPITQELRTGIFSPPMRDEMGMWTRSKIRGVKVISESMGEDTDLVVSVGKDGVFSENTLTIPLNVSGIVAFNRKAKYSLNEEADYFQLSFIASTDTSKWRPLGFAYNAVEVTEN